MTRASARNGISAQHLFAGDLSDCLGWLGWPPLTRDIGAPSPGLAALREVSLQHGRHVVLDHGGLVRSPPPADSRSPFCGRSAG